MIDFCKYHVKIDCVLSCSWKKCKAYAQPRKYHALSFRTQGNATFSHGGKDYQVDCNDLLFVPADYDYTITANKDEEVLVLHFYTEHAQFDSIEIFKPTNPDVFYRIFTQMQEIWRLKPTGYLAKLTSLFYKIQEQIEIQTQKRAFEKKPKKLQEALDYMHENFTNMDTTVQSTAEHIQVSTAYLRKIFHLSMGQSPVQYLKTLRINYARDLLKTGYYTIKEVAALSGFGDAKYCSSLLKKQENE